MEINGKPSSDVVQTTVEETTTFSEDSINKKQKIDNENSIKLEFDVSARKYIDWIDNIERILDEKPSNQLEFHQRKDIIQVNLFQTRLSIDLLNFFLGN